MSFHIFLWIVSLFDMEYSSPISIASSTAYVFTKTLGPCMPKYIWLRFLFFTLLVFEDGIFAAVCVHNTEQYRILIHY